jgi:hypothetical protein
MLKRRRSDTKSPKAPTAMRAISKKSSKASKPAPAASKTRAVKMVSSAPNVSAKTAKRAQPQLQLITNPTPPTDPTTLELLNIGGPALDTGELMRAWGISREAISQKRRDRKLLGVVHGNTTLHPRWQFDAHLDLQPWVAAVLQVMAVDVTPRFALRFFVYAHPALKGQRPAEVVNTAAGLKRVKELAKVLSEQGAR